MAVFDVSEYTETTGALTYRVYAGIVSQMRCCTCEKWVDTNLNMSEIWSPTFYCSQECRDKAFRR